MLVDVKLRPSVLGQILSSAFGEQGTPKRLMQGVYLCAHHNFESEFRRQDFSKDYPHLPDNFACCGVCDSPEQLLEKLPEEVKTGPTEYVVALHKLTKSTQPDFGGWRWHKWGPYIGTQTPQREYLYDEPVIETVYTYHVYLV